MYKFYEATHHITNQEYHLSVHQDVDINIDELFANTNQMNIGEFTVTEVIDPDFNVFKPKLYVIPNDADMQTERDYVATVDTEIDMWMDASKYPEYQAFSVRFG